MNTKRLNALQKMLGIMDEVIAERAKAKSSSPEKEEKKEEESEEKETQPEEK